jgi:protocatechuate 3,4-dioxygenase beta subunit
MRFVICCLIIVLSLGAMIRGQVRPSPQAEPKPSASISGRITIAGQPVPNALLTLRLVENSPVSDPVVKAVTDVEGRYQFTGLRAGRYTISAMAPAYVGPNDAHYGQLGKNVTLANNETVEGIDFALTRGGVITGRVTDANGQPVIEEQLTVARLDEGEKKQFLYFPINSMLKTDDRGIYRVYGLPAGRYLIGVGEGKGSGWIRNSYQRGYYTFTYHPDATEEAKAKIIEVALGSEVTNVDIKLGRVVRIFEASGRIVNAETGEPIPYAIYGYFRQAEGAGSLGAVKRGLTADSTGEFHIAGLQPGRYTLDASYGSGGDFYSEPVPFEIVDADVNGLEIGLHRAGSISGIVVIESASDPAVQRLRPEIQLWPVTSSSSFREPTPVDADGRFHIKGLRPGRVTLTLPRIPGRYMPKGLSISRVERDGVAQSNGIEVNAGEQVTGVRVVVTYGNATLRGQVRIEGGALPAGARVFVAARHSADDETKYPLRAEADGQGRFMFEGLRAGVYEVMAVVVTTQGQPAANIKPVKQTVAVGDGTGSTVTLVIELGSGEKEGER